jgi:hypothetical protein
VANEAMATEKPPSMECALSFGVGSRRRASVGGGVSGAGGRGRRGRRNVRRGSLIRSQSVRPKRRNKKRRAAGVGVAFVAPPRQRHSEDSRKCAVVGQQQGPPLPRPAPAGTPPPRSTAVYNRATLPSPRFFFT